MQVEFTSNLVLKGIAHPKIENDVITNLFAFLSSVEHQRKYFDELFFSLQWKSVAMFTSKVVN